MNAPAVTPQTEYRERLTMELDRLNATAVGDLNNLRHPSAYVHYIEMGKFETAVLEDRKDFRALCGFRWKKTPKVTELRSPGSSLDEFCPRCWVLGNSVLFGLWSR